MSTLDEQLNIRISSEDEPMIEKCALYRFRQGLLRKPTQQEYIRYLLNLDMTVVVAEINQRRK